MNASLLGITIAAYDKYRLSELFPSNTHVRAATCPGAKGGIVPPLEMTASVPA